MKIHGIEGGWIEMCEEQHQVLFTGIVTTMRRKTRGTLGSRRQEREEKCLIGLPGMGRDHLQESDVHRRRTQ
jgi:hypothetical protein